MKSVLLVLLVLGWATLAGASNQLDDKAALKECQDKLIDKIQALCGSFLDKEEITDMSAQMYDMYFKQNKSLEEIVDYYCVNYRSIGLDPDQVDVITNIYSQLATIFNDSNAIREYYKKALDVGLQFVKKDQEEIDQLLKQLKTQGKNEDQIRVSLCQQTFKTITAQKKISLENKFFAVIPADKLEAVKTQIRRVHKLLTDSPPS